MENKIRLELGSVFKGDGFKQAQREIENTAKAVQKAAGGMAQIGGELGKLDGKIGAVAGGLGNLLGSLAAGPMGVAVAGIGLVVSGLMAWKNKIDETRKAHEEMMAKMEEGHKRRVAGYAKKAHDAEIAALDAIISRGKRAIEVINARASAYKSLGQSEDAIARARDRVAIAAADGNEKAVLGINSAAAMRAADRRVYEAGSEVHNIELKLAELRKLLEPMWAKGEDTAKVEADIQAATIALSTARNNLAAAEMDRAAVELENENKEKELGLKMLKAEQDRVDAIEKETQRREAAAEKQMATEELELAQKEGNAKVKAIDEKIAKAKEARAKWEENAAKMRGVNFGDWLKSESAAQNGDAAFRRANAQSARRARRIRADARHGWASARDMEWLGKYDQWSAAQNAANNPAAKTLESLEKERAKAVKDMQDTVEEIKEFLKAATTPES